MVVIPWFLILGRPYPIQVYLYACGLYSSNPSIGQRGVANATRTKFRLEKFSHSTVSRSFKAFEQARKEALKHRFGEELKVSDAETPTLASATANSGTKSNKAPQTVGRFPSVKDTAGRRKEMAVFLQGYLSAYKEDGIEAASRQFVKYWHEKTKKLLL